ncbi:MAG: tRNA (adenosine(37)-N6)-threonylcarbamoyltransferase complex transferase subunit TsaD [Pseudomonadota bacterium]
MSAASKEVWNRVLAIESSCDETAAAIVDLEDGVLSSIVFDQTVLHAAYGGVVPEIAARAHAERVDLCVEHALSAAATSLHNVDGIAVTAGPGLIGGLLAGVSCAKGISLGTGKPILGVNHLAGHALTPRMTDGIAYPYLMLLVSGGHCQFIDVLGPDRFMRLGSTIDDAPGEAFDKSAKLMGLGYPGGPLIEKAALDGDATRFEFPRPLLDRPGCDMSFSGLKTALRRAVDALVENQGGITLQDRSDLSASFQRAVADILKTKSERAMQMSVGTSFAVAGGVAANREIRQALEEVAHVAAMNFLAPPLKYCTDNAAMIGWAGIELYNSGARSDLSLTARPRWPLDPNARPMLGSGKKGAKA